MCKESGTWSEIGEVKRTKDEMSDIESSERVLARVVGEGLFATVKAGTDCRTDYFESSSEWEDYLERRANQGLVGDGSTLERALGRLDSGEWCLRVQSEFRVGVYVKNGI